MPQPYVISFRRYDQRTIEAMAWFGLDMYISKWTLRLCALVRVTEDDKARLTRELGARGYFPEWAIVFENKDN